MDQDAFRSLLASRPAASSSQSSSKHVLGKAAPKRSAWGLKASAKTEKLLAEKAKGTEEPESKPDFVPRQQRRVPVKENGERYLDRAAMRREGKEDEYTEVARTLEDFERRQKEAGADDRQIAETRKHLGGDAEHSVLVKGLDFGLLAARKAELEREKEDLADEELDALLGGQKKVEKVEEKKVVQEEKMGKGSIGIKAEEPVGGEIKKKKKKKKVKSESTAPEIKQAIAPTEDQASKGEASAVPLPPPAQAEVKKEAPVPPPPEPEDEEDIFADVGGYDLNAGEEDSGSEDDHKTDLAESSKRPQSRVSSRSPRSRTSSEELRYPSRSRSREDRRPRHRSDSRDRAHDDFRRRRDSRDHRRHRERSDSRERDGRFDRYGRNDHYDRHDRYDRHHRYDSHERRLSPSRMDRRDRYDHYDDRHKSPDRSRSPRRYENQYDRQSKDEQRPYRRSPSPQRRRSPSYSRSPSPPVRRHSPSPTPPPAKRPRQRTRTPSPTIFQHHISSPASSDSEDEGPLLPGGKLQPLASSAMGDIKGFLAADADATKADEKRLRKAQWRARQGLAPQEGVDVAMLEKKLGEKQRANREYQLVMNQVNKAQKGDEGAGGAADE